jgi:hypothetical protein
MTDPPIQDIGMTDTEYATLTAKGYDSNLERMMIEAGSSPGEARKLTRIVGLVKDKPPETEEEWQEFMAVWEDACGFDRILDSAGKPFDSRGNGVRSLQLFKVTKAASKQTATSVPTLLKP